MDVIDLSREFVIVADVSVEPAAGLPESGAATSGCDLIEHWILILSKLGQPALCERLFDADEDRWHTRPRAQTHGRDDDEVDMLGHDNPGDQPEPVPLTGGGEYSHKFVSGRWLRKQLRSPIARKRDEPGLEVDLQATQFLVPGTCAGLIVRIERQ
jgi:hypothetical protein